MSLLLCSALLPLFICGKLQEVQAAALYQRLERKEDSEKKMWGNISICLAFASWPGAEGKHQGEQSTGLVNGEVLLLPSLCLLPVLVGSSDYHCRSIISLLPKG